MKKFQIKQFILIGITLVSSSLATTGSSLAAILSVPIELNITTSQETSNATGLYNLDLDNLNFSGTLDTSNLSTELLAFPIIPKAIVWGIKWLCPPPLGTPEPPEQTSLQTQTLVDFFFGGSTSGTMFDKDNNAVGAFQISNSGYSINVDISNQDKNGSIDNSFSLKIVETTNSNNFGKVTSQGFFEIDNEISENYSIEYDSLAVNPINNLKVKLNANGSLSNNTLSFSGDLSKVPEPTSTLALFALGTLGAGSVLKRKQK